MISQLLYRGDDHGTTLAQAAMNCTDHEALAWRRAAAGFCYTVTLTTY